MRIEKIYNRIHLIAEKGNVCTNGETYGSDIALEEGLTGEGYREITEAELQEILKREAESVNPVY